MLVLVLAFPEDEPGIDMTAGGYGAAGVGRLLLLLLMMTLEVGHLTTPARMPLLS